MLAQIGLLRLCCVTLPPWFRFQVYTSTKRVTDVHCANDTHVIFETSLWQFGEWLRPCACRRWPGLLPRYTPHCALKRLQTPPHPFTHQQTKCSVLHVWLAHSLLFMLNRGGGKDPRQDVPFIDMFITTLLFIDHALRCLCMCILASWVASILHWCSKECSYRKC